MRLSAFALPCTLAAVALASAAAGAPVAAPIPSSGPRSSARAELKPPETRAGGYRFVVERLQQQQNVAMEFAEAAEGKLTGTQSVSVSLAIYPPKRELVAHIDRLEQRIVAYPGPGAAEHEPIVFQSIPQDDTNPLLNGVWRTYLMAQELDLSVARLSRLQGELVVYPAAKRVSLELPLAGKIPVTREAGGLRCTVKQVRSRGDAISVTVEREWAPSLSVSPANADAQDGFLGVSKAGGLLYPRREVATPLRGGRKGGEYTLVFSDAKEVPPTLKLEMIVRSGAPARLAFTLPDMPLPDVQGLEEELDKAQGAEGPLGEDHPLYAREGGTLLLPLKGARPSLEGRLQVGLSRREGEGFGPWRRLEATLDRAGTARIGNLRPGHYRVEYWWAPGVVIPARGSARATREVDIPAGKTVTLPPLEAGAMP